MGGCYVKVLPGKILAQNGVLVNVCLGIFFAITGNKLLYLRFQTCEKLEEERITHLREMCSLYSNMLAAVIPQLQQVSISAPIFPRSQMYLRHFMMIFQILLTASGSDFK